MTVRPYQSTADGTSHLTFAEIHPGPGFRIRLDISRLTKSVVEAFREFGHWSKRSWAGERPEFITIGATGGAGWLYEKVIHASKVD